MKRLTPVRQLTSYSCGPARVRSLIQYWEDIDIPEKELRQHLNSHINSGTYPQDIIRYFKTRGYKCRAVHGMTARSLKYYLTRKIPVLVALKDHYYLVSAITDTHIVFIDDQVHTMPIMEFMKSWVGRDMDGIPYGRYGIVVRK